VIPAVGHGPVDQVQQLVLGGRRNTQRDPATQPQRPFPSASINLTPISFSASVNRAISARAAASSGSGPLPPRTPGLDAANDWRQSIRSQGVMTELWATATAYAHDDASPPVWTVTTAEGSSRMTAVHDILDERSVDLAYDLDDRQMRMLVRRHNEAFDRGASPDTLVAMRCEIVPVLFLVGFSTHPGGTPDFATAVKSLVALRHVDPPKPWGEGPEMEALADAVLEELQRRSVLTPEKRRWMAGGMTPSEASRAHLSSDPAVRAAAIVELFYSDDSTVRDAMRMAITAQSTRKNLSPRLKSQLATALIVRSVPAAGDNGDRIRRYMQTAFAKPVREETWQATTRSADDLLAAALAEVDANDAGAATLELAARGAYPLITTLRLWADRGTRDNEQPDRRSPGEVIDTMRRTVRGVQQLGHALNDHGAGQKIRVVDAEGAVVRTEDGAQDLHVTDTWVRHEFPAAGTIKAPASPNTAREKLQAKLADLGAAVEAVTSAMEGVRSIEGVDGSSLVDTEGVDRRHTGAWREVLVAASDELLLWGAKWRPLSSANGALVVDDDQDETGIDNEQDAA
jgi:hypothetical protein